MDPEIKKQVHDALISQFPTAPPAGTWVECANRTGPAALQQFMMAHHLAKVLA